MDNRFPQIAPQNPAPRRPFHWHLPNIATSPLLEWLAFATLIVFLLRG
jgi:hypothetical protein